MELTVFYHIEHICKHGERIVDLFILLMGDLPEETAPGTGMAGSPYLGNLRKDRILVTIGSQALHILIMSACLTLQPKLLSASAVVGHFAGEQGLLIGLLIHIGKHQHLRGSVVLHDHRHHAVGVFL